jgi:hypothetical protein
MALYSLHESLDEIPHRRLGGLHKPTRRRLLKMANHPLVGASTALLQRPACLRRIFTLFIVEFVGGLAVKPGEDVIEPMALLIIVPLFALCANVCYTLGWIVDLILHRSKPSLRLLVTGYGFSTVVTLIPAVFFCGMFLFHKLTGTYI